MQSFSRSSGQKTWQERYTSGIKNILEILKDREEKIAGAVETFEDSNEPKMALVKNINLCMITFLKKLENLMEKKVVDFSSFF